MPGLSMSAQLAGCATGSPADCSSGSVAVRVDEGQRHLAVQRGVERLPELQVRRTAVEDQQPIAAAGDDGAGYQMDVLVRGCGLDGRLARRVEGQSIRGWGRLRGPTGADRMPA